jgi:hypothetical protein
MEGIEIDFPKGTALSIIVHGASKAGKSTYANTAPAPRLLMDAEMAYRFLPGKKIFWDPQTEAPPKYDGSWELCVVIVREYADMEKASQWLWAGDHDFRSLVIDSISEIQARFKDQLISSGRMDQQTWGDLLYEMDKLVRGFRDLTEHKRKPLQAVVLTAMTQMKDGKYRPYVQGQLQTKLPYFMDVIGFLYVKQVENHEDPTKPPVKQRQMLVSPHDMFEAGERVQGRLPDVVPNPTVPGMIAQVFPETVKEETTAKESK